MKLLDLLSAWIPGAQGLEAKLAALIAAAPELGAALQPLLDGLNQNVSPEQITAALAAVEPEAAQFLKDWKLSPRQHPSDLV